MQCYTNNKYKIMKVKERIENEKKNGQCVFIVYTTFTCMLFVKILQTIIKE